MTWRSVVAGALTVAVAAGAIGWIGHQSPDAAGSQARARLSQIREAALVCPGVDGSAPTQGETFAVAPVTAGSVSGPGRLRLEASAAALPISTARLGRPLRGSLPSPASGSTMRVRARNGPAQGVTAGEWGSYRGTTGAGMAATWCQAPRNEWWFANLDTRAGATTRLVLANPSTAPALVDLQMFGGHGPVRAPGADGIALAPGAQRSFDMARFAPGQTALTLHVAVRRGTVVAAALTRRTDGITAVGTEWIPPSARPAASTLVGAGVAGQYQWIAITNTGDREAIVHPRVLGSNGPFTSTELPALRIAPGSVAFRLLSSATLREASAVLLHSSGPVIGSIASVTVKGTRDFSFAGVSGSLTAPAVVATWPGTTLQLALSSSETGASLVRIRRVAGSGRVLGESTVLVRGQATTIWSPPGTAASYLVVIPAAHSPVQAVATYTGPAGITQLPVLPGVYDRVRPAVLPGW